MAKTQEFLDLGFFRRWPARTEHLLGQVESNSRFALVFGDGEVVEHVKVAQIGGVGVPVLIGHPLPLCSIGVPRTDVFGLKML